VKPSLHDSDNSFNAVGESTPIGVHSSLRSLVTDPFHCPVTTLLMMSLYLVSDDTARYGAAYRRKIVAPAAADLMANQTAGQCTDGRACNAMGILDRVIAIHHAVVTVG
jgi:hypothetical protein